MHSALPEKILQFWIPFQLLGLFVYLFQNYYKYMTLHFTRTKGISSHHYSLIWFFCFLRRGPLVPYQPDGGQCCQGWHHHKRWTFPPCAVTIAKTGGKFKSTFLWLRHRPTLENWAASRPYFSSHQSLF